MGAAADAGVADQTVRAHGDAVADHHVAHQHGVDVEGDVLAALQISTDIQAGGIEQGDAGAHQRFCADPLIDPFQARQLHPVVDAVHFPGVAGLLGDHLHARVHGHGDQVGEVVFTLGVLLESRGRLSFRKRRVQARMPVLISRTAFSSSLASFCSTTRRTLPSASRITRP